MLVKLSKYHSFFTVAICLFVMPPSGGAFALLGQSLNVDAVLALGRVVASPGLAVPHISVPHIGHINWAALAAAGIKGVVFDKDNTLTAPYVDIYDSRVVLSVNKCRQTFGSSRLIILSNSAGGPDDPNYAAAAVVEAQLNMNVLRRQSKKPKGFDELLAWFNDDRATKIEQSDSTVHLDDDKIKREQAILRPHELCMVGDRALTDVVFGNMHGMLTVHVGPLTSVGDNKAARVFRGLENRMLLPMMRAPILFGSAKPPAHPALSQETNTEAKFVLEEPLEG
mmetsp:Transcript_66688/g.134426  ORF Transcript_66688/g.134426 Transcript_66688/m.134426 type:complete len:282 (+) Transcript_66688:53-898(+)